METLKKFLSKVEVKIKEIPNNEAVTQLFRK
jgi:hypothetical protein